MAGSFRFGICTECHHPISAAVVEQDPVTERFYHPAYSRGNDGKATRHRCGPIEPSGSIEEHDRG